ncbi:hypothetical protein Rsub_00811 [Raphidocelis subcapitata]|uniref:GH18 domain-containing protein n=1 Tax=Raphidocelis subcapitata TaxID=307507 RepID=A0A2V0NLU6_9CHLO|nr:hypothetical protein Rsub_00811 [Raphidocelis subcapitata]|eukprot:GBF88099.1 hypothetical protein Rsub_00811 [Raphidocelis subcapitata]
MPPAPAARLLVVAAAAALLFACRPAAATSGGAEISPSVMLIGQFDWQLEDTPRGPWSRCLDQLWRGAERSGSSQVNFAPTHHWLPPRDGGAQGARSPFGGGGGAGGGGDGHGASGVGSFCFMAGQTGSNKCYPWSDAVVAEFRRGMRVCFAEALRLGLAIAVRPHLDDGTGNGAWRNGLLFRPTERYGGASYQDLARPPKTNAPEIMLDPLADALRGALEDTRGHRSGGRKPTVYFAMQGEMSATVMRYPRDWAALAAALKSRVGPLADVRLGIGLNFNRLDDTSSTAQTYTSSRASWLLWLLGATDGLGGGGGAGAPPIDAEGVRQLLGAIDFMGVSAYAPLSGPGFRSSELENAAFMLGDEMRAFGVDLPALIDSGALELHYSEFGLGGGGAYAGASVAQGPGEVALRPFFGIYGPYARATDPWALPANKAFQREFYEKAAAWLSRTDNKTYRISAVFIWCLASWDVLAVYPESTTAEGSYHDAAIAAAVRAHNSAVRGFSSGGGAPPAAGR